MPWAAAIGAAATIGSAAISSSAAGDASGQITGANKAAISDVQATQKSNVGSITANEQPYTDLGKTAAGSLNTGISPGGYFTKNFTLDDLKTDPGYLFDLQQGNQAVQRSAAAQGTLNSGGTLKAIANYSTGLASNELQSAYNRYTNDQNNQFNRLYNLAGVGQNAVGQVNNALTNQANTVSNAQYGATVASGAANAAGTVGAANALSGGLQNLGAQFATSFGGSNSSSSGPSLQEMAGYGANNLGFGNTAYDLIQNSSSF